jgi:hypothetical protein
MLPIIIPKSIAHNKRKIRQFPARIQDAPLGVFFQSKKNLLHPKDAEGLSFSVNYAEKFFAAKSQFTNFQKVSR